MMATILNPCIWTRLTCYNIILHLYLSSTVCSSEIDLVVHGTCHFLYHARFCSVRLVEVIKKIQSYKNKGSSRKKPSKRKKPLNSFNDDRADVLAASYQGFHFEQEKLIDHLGYTDTFNQV